MATHQSSACAIGIIDNHIEGKSIPKPVKKANLKKMYRAELYEKTTQFENKKVDNQPDEC
jgi:hypothetical protein